MLNYRQKCEIHYNRWRFFFCKTFEVNKILKMFKFDVFYFYKTHDHFFYKIELNSEAFADYLSAIRDHIIQDREIWETFKTVLFPAMKKENQNFYMNVMKNI